MGVCTAFVFAALVEFTFVNYLWRKTVKPAALVSFDAAAAVMAANVGVNDAVVGSPDKVSGGENKCPTCGSNDGDAEAATNEAAAAEEGARGIEMNLVYFCMLKST